MSVEEKLPRGEQTQEEIIQAAYRLFIQNGYHGTSMRQIAQEAHLAVASIYNHFQSKEQIFLAVLGRYHPIFEVLPRLAQMDAPDVPEFVRRAARFIAAHLDQRHDFLNLFFIELVEFRACHIPQLLEKNEPMLTSFIQNFVAKKSNLRPFPPFVLARAFLGMFFA
ncbi:MAG: TetR/AcrR family transcriptional regulator, partial [Anaerolineales bacterium]|nr:TetR/AcrR family transcriptional regulator [Anaerolineales bacterium]